MKSQSAILRLLLAYKPLILTNFLALFLFAAQISFSQNPAIQLFGEGGGNHVKLLWLPKSWQPGWTAFQVKKRVAGQDWATAATIYPEISRSKDLTNVESDPAALARLKSKLEKWLSSGQTKEIKREEYLQKLASDPDAVKALYVPIALDYDFALVNGFGFVDRNFEGAAADDLTYEYALFVVSGQKEEQAGETFFWKFGNQPDVRFDVNLQVIPTHLKTQLEVRWQFDYPTFLAKNLNGFNLYRRTGQGKFQKLNETPLWVTAEGGTAKLSFFDKTAEANTAYTYAVAPLTIFGTEGERQEVTFDPSKLPGDVKPPELRVVPEAVGTAIGIAFEWDFAREKERFLRGFTLQRRANIEAAWENVSPILPPSSRSARNIPPQSGQYFFYRLKVEEDFGLNLFSNEMLLYYDPKFPPSPPTGLQGTYEKEGSRQFIRLRWNQKLPGDTLTAGYLLHSNFPPDTVLLLEGSIQLIRENSFRYEIFSSQSSVYRFALTAVSEYGGESARSEIAEVTTPSADIPNVNIWPFTVTGNQITLNWEYANLPDLAGFRIFQDEVQVADERQVGVSARQWTSPPLGFNTTYKFELQAVTRSGVASRKSIARMITTEKEQ